MSPSAVNTVAGFCRHRDTGRTFGRQTSERSTHLTSHGPHVHGRRVHCRTPSWARPARRSSAGRAATSRLVTWCGSIRPTGRRGQRCIGLTRRRWTAMAPSSRPVGGDAGYAVPSSAVHKHRHQAGARPPRFTARVLWSPDGVEWEEASLPEGTSDVAVAVSARTVLVEPRTIDSQPAVDPSAPTLPADDAALLEVLTELLTETPLTNPDGSPSKMGVRRRPSPRLDASPTVSSAASAWGGCASCNPGPVPVAPARLCARRTIRAP